MQIFTPLFLFFMYFATFLIPARTQGATAKHPFCERNLYKNAKFRSQNLHNSKKSRTFATEMYVVIYK